MAIQALANLRFASDISNSTVGRILAEQGILWASQHLDAFDIEQCKLGGDDVIDSGGVKIDTHCAD